MKFNLFNQRNISAIYNFYSHSFFIYWNWYKLLSFRTCLSCITFCVFFCTAIQPENKWHFCVLPCYQCFVIVSLYYENYSIHEWYMIYVSVLFIFNKMWNIFCLYVIQMWKIHIFFLHFMYYSFTNTLNVYFCYLSLSFLLGSVGSFFLFLLFTKPIYPSVYLYCGSLFYLPFFRFCFQYLTSYQDFT